MFDDRPAFICHQNDWWSPFIVFIVQPVRKSVLQINLHVFVTNQQILIYGHIICANKKRE